MLVLLAELNATVLRASEIVSMRWSDILWTDEQIRVSKRWAKGKNGETKTAAIKRLCADAFGNGAVPKGMAHAEPLFENR